MKKNAKICKVCASHKLKKFIDFGAMPIAHNLLRTLTSKEEEHPLVLHICCDCGMIQIVAPVPPEKLYTEYNYCFSSWKPPFHAAQEVDILKKHISALRVLEIGCNDGYFLDHLKQGGLDAVGVEPNTFAATQARANGHTVYEMFFTKQTAQTILAQEQKQFDAIAARHVLEHIDDCDDFFAAIDKLLTPDGVLLIEVPDFEFALRVGDCTAIWEEEPSYFTEKTLVHLLARYSFSPLYTQRIEYSGGALVIVAQRDPVASSIISTQTIPLWEKYAPSVWQYKEDSQRILSQFAAGGGRIVLYGAGCAACTLVNGLDLGKVINICVDDQPEKQHKFLPGSHIPVYPLENSILQNYHGSLLFLLSVNNENEAKVSKKIRERYPNAEMFSVRSPKDVRAELANFAKNHNFH